MKRRKREEAFILEETGLQVARSHRFNDLLPGECRRGRRRSRDGFDWHCRLGDVHRLGNFHYAAQILHVLGEEIRSSCSGEYGIHQSPLLGLFQDHVVDIGQASSRVVSLRRKASLQTALPGGAGTQPGATRPLDKERRRQTMTTSRCPSPRSTG